MMTWGRGVCAFPKYNALEYWEKNINEVIEAEAAKDNIKNDSVLVFDLGRDPTTDKVGSFANVPITTQASG